MKNFSRLLIVLTALAASGCSDFELDDVRPYTGLISEVPQYVVLRFRNFLDYTTVGPGFATIGHDDFYTGGDCSVAPSVKEVRVSDSGDSAVVELNRGDCRGGQEFTLIIDMTRAQTYPRTGKPTYGRNPEKEGVARRRYRISSASSGGVGGGGAPVAVLGSPSSSTINSVQSSTVDVSYTGGPTSTALSSSSGNSMSPPTGLTASTDGTAFCSVINLDGPGGTGSPSTSGAQITVAGCTGSGNLQVGVAAGAASNSTGSSAATSTRTIAVSNGGGGGPTTISSGATGVGGMAPTVGFFGMSQGNGVSITFSAAVTQSQADAVTLYCSSDSTYANSLSGSGGTAISDLGSATLSNGSQTVDWSLNAGGNMTTANNAGNTYCYLNVNGITGDSSVNASAKLQLIP